MPRSLPPGGVAPSSAGGPALWRVLACTALAAVTVACAAPSTSRGHVSGADGGPAASDPGRATPGGEAPPVLDLAGAAPPPVSRDLHPAGLVPEGDDPVLAEAPGGPVRASEVARFLFRFSPDRALDALNQILDERVIAEDARRHGIGLPPEVVAARVEEEVRRRDTDLRIQFGAEWTLETYLRDRFGFGVEAYRADLERLVRMQELRDRLVRLEALREDRIRIRVLVVSDETAARDAVRRLEEGADFTALARQVSLVPPADLPSYPRDEIHPPELAEELFSLPAGGVARPVRIVRDGAERFEVFKVVEVRRARSEPWSAVREEVERGLAERPVLPAEYLQWARRARERHDVKVRLEDPVQRGEVR